MPTRAIPMTADEETPPNPRLERTGGRPIRHAGATVAAGRSNATRWASHTHSIP